jgi:ABC-type sugar transport system permease subunit
MVLLTIFAIYPIVQVFWLSLFDYNLTSSPTYVGKGNYDFLASDPRFSDAFAQTVVYAVGTYVPALLLALFLAQLLASRQFGSGFVRLMFFLPVAISWVAVSIIWRVVLSPEGPLNQLLHLDVNWLTSSSSAPWALIMMSIWKETGFFLILFLAGMLGIPPEVYEAARLDGANAYQRMWHVTLPLLRPMTTVCVVMATLRGFQSFSPQVVMTGGSFGTEVVNLFVYKTAFENARMGRASAVAVLMFLLLLTVALVQMRALRRAD